MAQEEATTDRKEAILDAAERLIAERGYDHVSVQAIIDEVGIAKGTFYHHFRAKSDLLDALVMRLVDGAEPIMRAVVEDTSLGATDKLLAFFARMNAWKLQQRALLLHLNSALASQANQRVRAHLLEASFALTGPLIATIIEQGERESVFQVRSPAIAARLVMQVTDAMSEPLVSMLTGPARSQTTIEQLVDLVAAHEEAIERILGARLGSLPLIDRDSLAQWLAAGQDHP